MEKSKLRLRDYLDLAKLVQAYVETYGLSYEEAFKKVKEKLSSERVGAQINSDNNISKEFNDSISENIKNEN
ncbi:MAG: hypothetical protein E6585_23790 [Serratia marcescens]|nr:hypothetical protein [Serratia marcescens]